VKPWDADPVFITVAPVGAEVTRADHPRLPHTPAEVVAASLEAVEAGASVIHLHARLPDGTPSGDAALFAEMIEGIRAKSDALIMNSTGGAVWMSMEERTRSLEARPDICSLETGSLNFGDEVFATSRPDSIVAAQKARRLGIGIEVEAFDVGHVLAAARMLMEGHLTAPLSVNLVFGVPGGMDASPEGLTSLLRPLPPSSRWSVTAVGRHQRRMLALGILLGAHGIRVGFEDNVKLRRDRLAASNAELVQDAAELVRSLGRRVATPAETRIALGLRSGLSTGATQLVARRDV
jgi:3-keto-5-aminohexanoate cleavage enzyme